jgi:hypothetical protein
MIRVATAVPLCLLALAAPAAANTVGCGGNGVSYGEVDAQPPGAGRRGVIEAWPDSLCADLIERRRRSIDSLDIVVEPPARGDEGSAPSADRRTWRRRQR